MWPRPWFISTKQTKTKLFFSLKIFYSAESQNMIYLFKIYCRLWQEQEIRRKQNKLEFFWILFFSIPTRFRFVCKMNRIPTVFIPDSCCYHRHHHCLVSGNMSQQTTAARTSERAMAGARRRPAFFVFCVCVQERYALYVIHIQALHFRLLEKRESKPFSRRDGRRWRTKKPQNCQGTDR